MEDRTIFSNIWIRSKTDNLAYFKTATGNYSIVGGSELHCYKGTSSVSTFTADISNLENSKTYRFVLRVLYGTRPSSCVILNSSGGTVKTLSTTSTTAFTKTADMKSIKVTINPTKMTSVSAMLSATSDTTYVPYLQQVEQIAYGDKYVEELYDGRQLVYYYQGSVIRYGTEDKNLTTPGGFYKGNVLHNLHTKYTSQNPKLLCFDGVMNVFPSDIFGSSSKINMVAIPKEMHIPYNDKVPNLAARGDLYIHKDSDLLTYTNFLINFNGWRLFLYDRDFNDIVGLNDMSGNGDYAYGN